MCPGGSEGDSSRSFYRAGNHRRNSKISLSPWLFAARPAYALHHGNTGSAKSWGASTPPNSRVRTVGEKLGLPHPREWFFNASESDLSDGHLIFARDPVEFLCISTFRAMSEIRIEGAWGGRHPPCIYLKGDQSPCILDPQMFWFCIAGLSRTGIHRKYVFPELSERKISDFRREISVASNQKEAHSHAISF